MGYYSAIKNNETLPFATMWTEIECIMFSEISQTKKDKYSVIIYMWNLKNKPTTEYNRKETDSQV